MMRFSILCLFLFFLTSWIDANEPVKFELYSPDLLEGQPISAKYSCFDNDITPPIEFKNIPVKTKTFAVTAVSPDAPEGVWVHWVVYNIDAKTNALKEGATLGTPLFNDFGKFSYNGPCPTDDKEHHYVFTAYALNTKLDIIEGGILKDLEKAMRGHILGQSSITVSFRKRSQ